ncbi:hypothetical protein AZH53_06170 [Methanomicrobiaceae archaeon CYW5]|nr:hypothetical protein [Methanovulcanius yangii]
MFYLCFSKGKSKRPRYPTDDAGIDIPRQKYRDPLTTPHGQKAWKNTIAGIPYPKWGVIPCETAILSVPYIYSLATAIPQARNKGYTFFSVSARRPKAQHLFVEC